MVNVSSKMCENKSCNKQPIFGFLGQCAIYCAKHKLENMVNVKHEYCNYIGCNKINPRYVLKDGTGKFCTTHKKENMINVKTKLCVYTGCNITPLYNYIGNKGLYCKTHKLENMIDVESKKCEYNNCDTIPNFGISGGKIQYCSIHKTTLMIDLRNKKCLFKDCGKQPHFGLIGEKPKYCASHKQINMIDLLYKKCKQNNCILKASYGLPGTPLSHCSKHRIPGMIRRSNSKCIIKECKEKAHYGNLNYKPIHCETHKDENDINLIEKECCKCGLVMILDTNNICEYCNPESFKRVVLAKQNALMEYLDSRNDLPNQSTTDTIIDNGICGKERPDRVYELEDKIIVLECDEFQHKSRSCECEQIRMINIGQIFGGTPVYFIRWNPDDYIPFTNKALDKITKRYKLVGDLVRDISLNKIDVPHALISVIYLYYDNWNEFNDEKWKIILDIQSENV
jgi:hypothetical protein